MIKTKTSVIQVTIFIPSPTTFLAPLKCVITLMDTPRTVIQNLSRMKYGVYI